jgi:monoamine oxidase
MGADYDVVIIGAGMAGMTAARLLSKAGPGLKVIILEARDRVGGRMYSAPGDIRTLPTHGVELGAQLIHGSRAATWELIKEFGIETRPRFDGIDPETHHFSIQSGKSDVNVHSLPRLQVKLAAAYRDYRGPDISYQSLVDTLDLSPAEMQLLASDPMTWSAEPDRVSLSSMMTDNKSWDEWWDQDFQVVGGHGLLARKMAESLTGKIQLNSQVKEIFWSEGIAGVTYDNRGSNAALSTRRLILTLPVGVLQSGQVQIQPALPDWKQRAVDSLEMGQVVVVPMLFSEAFWSDAFKTHGSWTTLGNRVNFWIPHAPGHAGKAIQGWFSGSAAQELSDLGPEEGLIRVLYWLQQASGRKDLAEKLVWHHFQDWVRDPYSLGSYSFTRPGGVGNRADLAKPVANTVHFAGEATAEPPHYQTVHGAYMSGKRAAEEVIASLNLGDSGTIMEDAPVLPEEEEAPIINPL